MHFGTRRCNSGHPWHPCTSFGALTSTWFHGGAKERISLPVVQARKVECRTSHVPRAQPNLFVFQIPPCLACVWATISHPPRLSPVKLVTTSILLSSQMCRYRNADTYTAAAAASRKTSGLHNRACRGVIPVNPSAPRSVNPFQILP